MKRRWMLVGLALVAIIAIAVPALAGDGGKSRGLLDASRLAPCDLLQRKLWVTPLR
jgi:hypothetical protein